MWSWGSPVREVRWTKAAATSPEVSIRLSPPCAAAGHGGVALEVGQPFGDRLVVGGPDGGRGLRVAEPPQHRDGLGSREGEVEPRHPG